MENAKFGWSLLTSIILVAFWLGGLSWAVAANSDNIEKLSDTDVKIARIEERQDDLKEDVEEIADTQDEIQSAQTEQTKMLVKISMMLDSLEEKVDND